jgi:hypothetical protein
MAGFFDFTIKVRSIKKLHDANSDNLDSRDSDWRINSYSSNVLEIRFGIKEKTLLPTHP